MLTIKCSGCKRKLWKYIKLGQGQLLRCHKSRIEKIYKLEINEGQVFCPCGRRIGIDKGHYYKMIPQSFVYTGQKQEKF